jgi:transcription-repair coupling factor (superfamily II helicase)
VPIDQADKVNKFIGADDNPPKLTRLGSAEWNTITRKIRKETEEIAKELLVLYAERKSAKGFKFKEDDKRQEQFEKSFPYEETPGSCRRLWMLNMIWKDLFRWIDWCVEMWDLVKLK